jgi:hypothetical protein
MVPLALLSAAVFGASLSTGASAVEVVGTAAACIFFSGAAAAAAVFRFSSVAASASDACLTIVSAATDAASTSAANSAKLSAFVLLMLLFFAACFVDTCCGADGKDSWAAFFDEVGRAAEAAGDDTCGNATAAASC